MAIGAVLFFLFFSFVAVLGLGSFVVWIAALVSCLKNEPSTGNTKLIWALVIIFTHFIGALVYFLVRRPERIREVGH